MKKILAGLIIVIAVGFFVFRQQTARAFVGSFNNPSGFLDAANCSIIGGWNADLDYPSSRPLVHIYDGTNTTPIASINPVGDRSLDFATSAVPQFVVFAPYNIGFNIPTPASVLDDNAHLIHAFAQDIDTGGGSIGFKELNTSPISLGPCKVRCNNNTLVDTISQCPTTTCRASNGTTFTHQLPFTCLPNAPTLSISTFDCTAINFWTADPDVSGQPLTFLVASSSPVNLFTNVIGGGTANLPSPLADPPFNGVPHGGSWVIQPADKDTNSHTYFILAAGKAANNVNDGFNTETPQATPITIGPCVTVPQPPILRIDRATCDDGIIISARDPDSPGSGIGIYVSENSDMSNALGGGVANGSPAFASISSHGLLFTGIKKDISMHTYFIKAYGVNGATPVALEGPDAADSVSIMNCITPSPGITTPPTPIPPPVDNAPTNQPDLFKQACIDNPAAAVCNDRDRNQTPTDNSFFGNDGIVAKVANTLSIIIGVASVLVAMVAGFKFIASAGDANQVASAKRTVLFAVIGVVVAIFAQAIIIFVLKGL